MRLSITARIYRFLQGLVCGKAHRRKIDFQILAPTIKRRAPNKEAATLVARIHMLLDPAWDEVLEDLENDENKKFVEACGGSNDIELDLRRYKDSLLLNSHGSEKRSHAQGTRLKETRPNEEERRQTVDSEAKPRVDG
jgi:hypothetical protein